MGIGLGGPNGLKFACASANLSPFACTLEFEQILRPPDWRPGRRPPPRYASVTEYNYANYKCTRCNKNIYHFTILLSTQPLFRN